MVAWNLFLSILLLVCLHPCWSETVLPSGSAPKPIEFTHFPSRLHAFVWRNWPIVDAQRLANVLETTPDNVRALAESMGLPDQKPIPEKDGSRIYITLLRRNWHLLPYDQMLTLLGMTAEQLATALREDDFLFAKLGMLKPNCERLIYSPPSEEAQKRCREIQALVQDRFGVELREPEEAPFHFIQELSQVKPSETRKETEKNRKFSPCYIYSYFALYGDPLMNPELDPYPDGLLQKLSDLGVDGIWMHTVLRQLAPSKTFPEFGQDCETRLQNLSALVQRAKRFGIGIYLYVNEPRSMTADFFKNHESVRGVQEGDYYAMCTSTPEVRQWISDSLAYVFKNVPDLAGVFTISASENLTNCASHYQEANCPHCKGRRSAEIVAEANAIVEEGVHRGNPNAKVIVWDWGWNDGWAPEAIGKLPKSVYFMSVSEWSKPFERGAVKGTVGEYSISVVGPGPRATRHWEVAKKAGLKTIAKIAINNTWEISSVPNLPALDLVAEHCQNLLSKDVDGLMLSWTLGGYPSPNLALVDAFRKTPTPSKEEALDAVAQTYYGQEGAPLARQAWTQFSAAFQKFPYGGGVMYLAPQQYGPSNLLFPKPSGYSATMVGFPYDDVAGWCNPYLIDSVAQQFAQVAKGWKQGLEAIRKAAELAPPAKREDAQAQARFAEAAQLHFATVDNQIRFCALRNALLDSSKPIPETERPAKIADLKTILESEIETARRLFTLARQDSCIGYEASNQYYYLPVDLMEKVVNCEYILENLETFYSGKANR